ncbi:tetratricopeptide repeat protein [Leptospira borgpetersenii]|uniref:Tetratricopeptide repeat protein n=1 Tax=Leptospira borgpetersenii str. Brem 328 TaxID=1049780 RepID=A0ABC9SG91_LEPBO|nr:tetratricopeptide repeat protein [Leptospira borgpetersenii]EMN11554.1 tetratricopeptide repeat protein [Leptospira borgpetersenii str. Brem 307]EMN16798.1 tetratricopeptide repeat protein [Leptospira borgpetersenii str. Brem 328]
MNQRKLIILFVVIFGISTNCFGDTLPTMEEQSKAFQFNQQGIALLGKGDFIQARSFFEKASKLHPQHPEYTNNIGVTYLNEGKLDQAIMYFTQSTEKNPSYARAFYNLGVVHQKQQNNEKALQNYLKTVNIDNSITEAYFNLGIIYTRMGNKKQAIESYQKFIDTAPVEYDKPKKDAKYKIEDLKKE